MNQLLRSMALGMEAGAETLAGAATWFESLQYPAFLIQVWAGILVLFLAVVVLRRRSRPANGDRWAQARTLAARGATPLEIARATGLSQDAAGMLLHASGPAGERMILPLSARISGPGRVRPQLALWRRSA